MSVANLPSIPSMNEPKGPADENGLPQRRAKQPWRDKFRVALRGIKVGIRGETSFFVHFFAAALVIATAIALNCDPYSWCLLLLCIGFVFVSEMFNTALETLFRGLDERVRNRCYRCLDISAGAVFLASVTAVLVGAIIFLRRLAITFHWM